VSSEKFKRKIEDSPERPVSIRKPGIGGTPLVTASSTDQALSTIVDNIWPCLDINRAVGQAAILNIAYAMRALLARGQSPDDATRTIGTLAIFMSGADVRVNVKD
jgi:hypothetical protein